MSDTENPEPKKQKIKKPKARRPRGFEDRMGPRIRAEHAIIEKVRAIYQAYGFEPLETSAIEYADALGKFLPDEDRPNDGVFGFKDDDEQWLALRYDLTAPLARFAAENYDALPKPFRRYEIGAVWRNEKPGPGRYRQFTQCDADIVGAPGPEADAEMCAMAADGLAAAGMPAGYCRIAVNTRTLLDAVLADAGVSDARAQLVTLRAVDKLDRLGATGVRQLLGKGRKDESGDFTKGAELDEAQIEAVMGFVTAGRATRGETIEALGAAVGASETARKGLAELAAMDKVLDALGYDAGKVAFDPAIVRGLEYYTGPVFEAQLTLPSGVTVPVGSVGGGGRYDGLIARFKGVEVPSTGFSFGVTRLAFVLEHIGALKEEPGPVVVLVMDEERLTDSFAMARELRAGGVAAEVYLGGAGMRAQFKYADKRGASIAVIEGEDERARGVVQLKDLALGKELSKDVESRQDWVQDRPAQIETPRAGLVQAVKDMLAR